MYINYIILFLLFTSYLAKYIEPEKFIIAAFTELIYPVIIFTTCCFTVFWALKFKKPLLYNILIILLGVNTHHNFYKFKTQHTYSNETIKVTTWNIRHFNKYKWIHEEYDNLIKNEITEFIKDSKSDILCIQEFHDIKNLNIIPFKNKYVNSNFQNKNPNSGLLIASNLEFINQGSIEINNNIKNPEKNKEIIYVDVILKNDTIRIYNIHLASIHLNENEIKFIKSPSDKKENLTKNVRGIINQLYKSFIRRSKEIAAITKHIKNSPYKCIVTGDFNDTPNSYSTTQMSNILNDTFLKRGTGFGKTYKDAIIPLRIDYIFIDKKLKCNKYKTYNKTTLSDHYPVSAEITY